MAKYERSPVMLRLLRRQKVKAATAPKASIPEKKEKTDGAKQK